MPVSAQLSLNAAISFSPSGRAAHCMLLFVKIWMQAQPTSRPRSGASSTPPEMDMCAPMRSRSTLLTAGRSPRLAAFAGAAAFRALTAVSLRANR